MYVTFICRHCGKAKDRHTTTTRARNSDFSPLPGYETSFRTCPGFEEKQDQRKAETGDTFSGPEKRLKPPPATTLFDERQKPRTGVRERSTTFAGDDRRRKYS